MPKKLGRIKSRMAKNKLAKREYNKYFQDAKREQAKTTRKRESAQRKARATAHAKAKFGMTSAEKKTARREKLKALGEQMEGMGGGGDGFDADAFLNPSPTKTIKKQTAPKKTKIKIAPAKRKTPKKKTSSSKYVVVNGKAYPVAVTPTKRKTTKKRASTATKKRATTRKRKSKKRKSQDPTEYYTSMF